MICREMISEQLVPQHHTKYNHISATRVHRSHEFGAIVMGAHAFSPVANSALEAKTAGSGIDGFKFAR